MIRWLLLTLGPVGFAALLAVLAFAVLTVVAEKHAQRDRDRRFLERVRQRDDVMTAEDRMNRGSLYPRRSHRVPRRTIKARIV